MQTSLLIGFDPTTLTDEEINTLVGLAFRSWGEPRGTFSPWLVKLLQQEQTRRLFVADGTFLETEYPGIPTNWSGPELSEALLVCNALSRCDSYSVRVSRFIERLNLSVVAIAASRLEQK